MQVSSDPRHLKRQEYLQILFQWDFRHHEVQNPTVAEIVKNMDKIDETIARHATMWKIDEMAKIDVAILRLAVWELLFAGTPKKTAIDEAIELAKEFGNEKSHAFISGVLGKIYDANFQG